MGCDKYIMVFHNNFTLNYKGVIHINSNEGCSISFSFGLFYDGNNYTILTDYGNGISFIKSINDDFEQIAIESLDDKTDIETITTIYKITDFPTTNTGYLETNYSKALTTNLETEKLPIKSSIIESGIHSITITNLEANIHTIKSSEFENDNPTFKITIPTISTINSETSFPNISKSGLETNIPTIITSSIKSNIFSENSEIINEIDSSNEEIDKNILKNKKCETSDLESAKYNLCTSCNIKENYFPALFPKEEFLHGFFECYNNETKPINFYFDSSDEKYKPCYETCETCIEGGNWENHKCLTCDINHRKKPKTTNCVTECFHLFYFTPFGQYKCTNNSNCPDEASLYIKELKKCTNDCNKEGIYKYQYGGRCFKNCPEGTLSNKNNICKDININACKMNENKIDNLEIFTTEKVDLNANNYAKVFGYTIKQVSYFYNNKYSILIYKDVNCIEELSINMPKIDFGSCYTKVKNNLVPPTNDKIIITLVKISNGQKKSSFSYSFYHPKTGEKIDAETICKDENIIVKESVLSQLNNSDIDINSIFFLTQQNINIFNLSDEFYTDICYHFESPNGKDVPLGDRIKTYFPNITLCDSGCSCMGVNLTSMESICDCKFNNIIKNEFIGENALISSTFGEIHDFLSNSNFRILKCYKDVFKKEFIFKNIGGFIIIIIIFFEIIFSLIVILYNIDKIRNYLFNLTKYFMIFNKIENNHKSCNDSGNSKIKSPPKKKKKKKSKKKKFKNSKILNEEGFNLSASSNKSETIFVSPKQFKIKKNNFLNKDKNFEILNKYNLIHVNNLSKIKTLCGNIDMEDYLKPDLDDLEYDDAIKSDRRSFCEFLRERLKEKQIIINTFFNNENLRPKSIKIMILLLDIDLYFVINGLFYSEEYLSELFNSTEEETFFSFLPRSMKRLFNTSIVDYIIRVMIDCIFIEERKIKRIFLREKNDIIKMKYEISVIIKSIKIRYTIFIILCFLISFFSWYYVSCFNNTFPGIKLEWIKSSITFILIIQILSFCIIFFEGFLRALSFSCKSEFFYKIKKFIS